ncbi:hypothetical protein MANES_01G198160v8 [Manihot esculenta]|uniref:Uncharacterized protein n=1 Tax=Manihot esculenta TaxID=3983 RepID=A0ACB7IGJ9_MANES|nr:hypothetical protein MANES_01G198160v8 [Manihot esculenta]
MTIRILTFKLNIHFQLLKQLRIDWTRADSKNSMCICYTDDKLCKKFNQLFVKERMVILTFFLPFVLGNIANYLMLQEAFSVYFQVYVYFIFIGFDRVSSSK